MPNHIGIQDRLNIMNREKPGCVSRDGAFNFYRMMTELKDFETTL